MRLDLTANHNWHSDLRLHAGRTALDNDRLRIGALLPFDRTIGHQFENDV